MNVKAITKKGENELQRYEILKTKKAITVTGEEIDVVEVDKIVDKKQVEYAIANYKKLLKEQEEILKEIKKGE